MSSELATIDISRVRGDTFPIEFTLKDSSGVAVDITGFSFLLTVDPSSDPVDSNSNLFQKIGVITDATGGVFEFSLLVADADQTPNTYFFDVQMTDAGGDIRTIAKGEWQVTQDITK